MINQALSRIIPQEPLSDDNLFTWASDIRTGLGSYYYSDYIMSDNLKDESGSFTHEVSRKCITAWILRQMKKENRSRFEPKITTYTGTGPVIQDRPAKPWSEINDHHAARLEELVLLAEQSLNKINQSESTPLNVHMHNFQQALNLFKSLGGNLSENEIGQKLLISLSLLYYRDARDISVLGISYYDGVVKQLKRRLTTEAFLSPPTKVKNTAEASATSKRSEKCTKKRCNGVNHSPEQCFKKPGNKHLQQEWIAE